MRDSKVRHVYCDPAKPEFTYQNLKLSAATGDHNYIKGNPRYFGVPVSSGGGSLAVIAFEKTGKQGAQPPVLDGHKGPVLDFDFNPFHDHVVATGGDDAHVMVWGITPGGLTENMKDPLVDLKGHQRKITVVRFHPTSEHVLATGSLDNTVKLWDVEAESEKGKVEEHPGLLLDLAWSEKGHVLATSCKDKNVRLYDTTSQKVSACFEAHQGTKTTKLEWLNGASGDNLFCSVGFTRQSKREFKIWDMRNLAKELSIKDLDQAAGVIMPFYDPDVKMLYLAGKGDGNVRYFEIVDGEPWQFSINEYRATTPCRGMAMLPKRCVDVSKCEVSRLLKLSTSTVEPLSFILPRKSDLFQEDIFPDCYAGKASQSADDFFSGKVAKPILMSLDPAKRKDEPAAAPAAMPAKKDKGDAYTDLDKANKRIHELEALLKKHGVNA